jgi:hypothetical protein
MQPGLRRLDPDAHHLSALVQASDLFLEKQQVSRLGKALHVVPGFDAGPAIESIWQQARRDGVDVPHTTTPMDLVLRQDLALMQDSGIGEVWSTDCIAHASNAVEMAQLN